MSAVNILLDKAKEKCSANADSALAERLGVSRQLFSQWRNGTTPMPDERIAHVAALAKEDAGVWLARIRAEQSAGEAQQGWESVVRRLLPLMSSVRRAFGLSSRPAPESRPPL